jgi:hypothetical protein
MISQATSMKFGSGWSNCSIGIPRYRRIPFSPSMNVILLAQAPVFPKPGS